MSWLIDIVVEQHPPSGSESKPRIPKVTQTHREIESKRTCFDPMVVSFGPYHHGKDSHLMQMKHYKKVAARRFISRSSTAKSPDSAINSMDAENVYHRFVAAVERDLPSLRGIYANDIVDKYDHAELLKMMFLDGCFVFHFIHLVVNGSRDDVLSHLNQQLIIRHMFLL